MHQMTRSWRCAHCLPWLALLVLACPLGAGEAGAAPAEPPPEGVAAALWTQAGPLMRATLSGDAVAVKRLLEAKAEVDERSDRYTPLMQAAMRGDLAIVKLLLEHGAEVDAKRDQHGPTALFYAVIGKKDEVAAALVQAGAKEEPDRIRANAALVRAACRDPKAKAGATIGKTEPQPSIEELVREGADVNAIDPLTGMTPLMYAANLGLLDNVRELLRLRANVNRRSNGMTALSVAKAGMQVWVVEALKDAGAKD